jgi:hypothetical protein
MIEAANIFAQSSFGLSGYWSSERNTISLMNSFENNPSNFSLLKDWGLSLSYGGEFSNEVAANLYLLSLSKRIAGHTLSARYTPGYQKEFIFGTGESIILEDSSLQSLSSRFTYKELFGLGYSYKFLKELSAGFSLRYFSQEFNRETIQPVFGDTNYIIRGNESEKTGFWKADLGLNYSITDNFILTAASINLLNFKESMLSSENQIYELKREKGALFGLSYSPVDNFEMNILYETNNSFQAGSNVYFNFSDNDIIGFGITAFHDRFQYPFVAGIIPAITYSSNLLGITISGVKYFSDRTGSHSFSQFSNEGISNILNNNYSFDKVILTLSFALNTIRVKSAGFVDIKILRDIYPTLSDDYTNKPFASADVVNFTGKPVSVKPLSRIEGMNTDWIQSPEVTISPMDTSTVYFYTIIPNAYSKNKAEISYVDFSLAVTDEESEDKIQKPVLINSNNAWDGNVSNLHFFIKKDLNFSINYSKNVLSKYKQELDTIPYALSQFHKSKIIFNNFIKELVYTSDPRATAEYVQFPKETLELKGGDCDDLSVCYSSLLEAVGIETSLIDYRPDNGIRHVNLLINTGLAPDKARLITGNDNKFFVRKNENGDDEIWIPIETTSLTDFDTAWQIGSEKFTEDAINKFGLVTGSVEIIDIN